jgi:integrase
MEETPLAKTLTAAAVRNTLPGKARREIPDAGCPGLHLVIQPSGRKSWALRFRRPGGKSAKLTLGPADLSGKEMEGEPVVGSPLTLAAARRLASEVNRQRAMGRDVVADQKKQHDQFFGAAARDFVETHAMKETRRWQEQARLLGLRAGGEGLEAIPGGLADRWARRPVAEIDSHLIHDIVDEVRRRGVPGLERRSARPTEAMARVMFGCLSKMFSWLVQNRRIEKNPCAGLHRPRASGPRDRVLTDDELRWFFVASGELGEPFGPLLKILVLTGQRLNEVAAMTRSELGADNDGRPIWTLPKTRTKNKKIHVVPLSPMVHELIDGARKIEGSAFIFTTTGKTPVSGWSKIKKRLDARMIELSQAEGAGAIPPWHIHDLRRTCASGLQCLKIPLPVTERVLNHISGSLGGIVGVYQRYDYSDEKREALERWAMHVRALTGGSNISLLSHRVIPMRKGGSSIENISS